MRRFSGPKQSSLSLGSMMGLFPPVNGSLNLQLLPLLLRVINWISLLFSPHTPLSVTRLRLSWVDAFLSFYSTGRFLKLMENESALPGGPLLQGGPAGPHHFRGVERAWDCTSPPKPPTHFFLLLGNSPMFREKSFRQHSQEQSGQLCGMRTLEM